MAVEFISPSALGTWLENQIEYYHKYVAAQRPPRIPQNAAMSVGSSFDSYVKARLHTDIFGEEETKRKGYDFETLFEKSVEAQNRDFALKAGADSYRQYIASGAYGKLLLAANQGSEVRFEYTLDGRSEPMKAPSTAKVETTPVVIYGKPDMSFRTKGGVFIMLDWKVNGYCSKSGHSPAQGYILKHGTGAMHKDAHPAYHGDVEHNLYNNVETVKPDWGRQLCAYSWLNGAEVGSEYIVQVEQLAFRNGTATVVTHRCMLSQEFQHATFDQFQHLWDIVKSGWFFRDLPREESDAKCKTLDVTAAAYEGEDERDEWLRSIRGK